MKSSPGQCANGRTAFPPALISFIWGFAEATVFFIVPDVYSSRRAIDSYRAGLTACLFALAGALCGGALLFALSHQPAFATGALQAFDHLPGISPALIQTTAERLQSQGAAGFFTSAAAGAPYKVCVVHAASGGMSWGSFLAVSVAARFLRFSVVTLFVGFVAQRLLRSFGRGAKLWIHAIVWSLFYTVYFLVI